MRVLQIGAEWPTERPGGLNTYCAELIGAMVRAGIDVTGLVVGSDQIHDVTNGTVTAVAPVNAGLMTRLWRVRRAANAALRKQPVDAIAVHFALYAVPILDQLKRFPTVVHFHGPWAFESGFEGAKGLASWAKASLERSVYSKARRFIVLSKAFRGDLISKYGVPGDKVRVVPGGVDITMFNDNLSRREARERLGWPVDRPIIVSIRRLVRRMGLENLIDAAAIISKHNQDFLLFLGGTGPIAAELQTRIDGHGLQPKVKLMGRIEDIAQVYRAADLSVVPSQALEGFGLVAVESLASGTPVYVTPVGGLPEVVGPFAPDCVFKDTTTRAIAEVLGEVLKGNQPMPSPEACRLYATSNFSWADVASRVLSVYQEALS